MFSDMKIFKQRIKDGYNHLSLSEKEFDKLKQVRLTYLYRLRRFNLKLAIYFGVFSLTLFLFLGLEVNFEIQYFSYALIGASAVYLMDVFQLRNPMKAYENFMRKALIKEKKILEES